jgi:tRNA-modifying protein YgfZ
MFANKSDLIMNERWNASLQEFGAVYAAGRVSHFAPTAGGGDGANSTALCDLSHYGVIRISGPDACSFLQSQFTNDAASLQQNHVQLNGWCSPKGRLLATFSLWHLDSQYFLLLPLPLLGSTLKRLGMFVLRSKVQLEDVSNGSVRIGLVRHAAHGQALMDPPRIAVGDVVTTNHGLMAGISASRSLLIVKPERAHETWLEVRRSANPAGANVWDLGLVRDGIVEVYPATQDLYVPQMANFELAGGVSFKKGCYPGQEIVARTQYRGILKRRMARVSALSNVSIEPGREVFSPAFPDQAAGSIAVSAVAENGTQECLVVSQTVSIQPNGLYLDQACSESNRLNLLDLPYSVPTAA